MKCTSVVANAGNVEDFGKVIVEVLGKTHYNRGCPKDTPYLRYKFEMRKYQ